MSGIYDPYLHTCFMLNSKAFKRAHDAIPMRKIVDFAMKHIVVTPLLYHVRTWPLLLRM